MRRDQTDELSQAVRNLAGNPAFVSTSGTQNMRTNLSMNPSFEVSNATASVRTNLAPNPRGVNAFSDYAGGATLTITGNVAITGNPDGITTANRVEYTSASVNPGVALLDPLTAGWQYTASAWIYHETVGGGTQGLAQAGIASQPSPPAITQGVWVRLSWTFTASGTSKLGFRVSSNTAAGSYLITGILVEPRPDLAPFFDGATSATSNLVKTAASPLSGVTITTGINYAGSTWNRSTVITGSAALIARQNVLLSDLGPGGKTYTTAVTVANDQAFSQQVSLDWCDTGYVTVTLAPGEVRRLVTTSARATYDSTFRFADLAVSQSTTETRSVLYRDWVIEEGTTSGEFYPATGDFSYVWNGTANASTSSQRAANAQYWTASTNGTVYQSVINPQNATKCGAVTTKGTNGDGTYVTDIAVVPGTTYTSSVWVKLTSALPSFSGVLRWKDSGQAILLDDATNVVSTLTVGNWVRVSVSAVAPANTAWLQTMWRVYATHTATTFYLDGALIEAWPNLQPYFDGNTSASGDFTYAWGGTGTAHHNISYQRSAVIPATSASKSGAAGYLDSKFFNYQSTAEDGVKTCKWVSPAGTPNSNWRVAAINGNSSQGWDMSKVKAGGRYTLWMRYRSSGWGTNQIIQIQIADGTSLNPVIGNEAQGLTLNQTGWQEYRRTFTAIRDATTNSCLYMSLPTIPQAGTDGIFEIREWMLVEGEYNGDYIDGSKPFSKWDSTANLSTSIGYPQQFLGLAGAPLLDYSVAGNYASLDNSFGPQEARSFYTVIEDLVENTGAVDPIIQYGDLNLNDTVPNTYIQLRIDNHASVGASNLFLRRTGPQGVGYLVSPVVRYVVAWGINDSGQLFMGANGSVRLTDVSGTMSLLHQRMLISTDSAQHKHIRTIMYRGLHDSTTSTAVQRYLGNKYGASVA